MDSDLLLFFSMSQVIDGYYNKVNDPHTKGGSFFAVCRGKVRIMCLLSLESL